MTINNRPIMKKLVLFSAMMALLFSIQAQQPAKKVQQDASCQKATCQKAHQCHKCCSQKEGSVEDLSVEAFAKVISMEGVSIVDVRTEKEYAAGHIKDAMLVPWGDDFKEQLNHKGIKPCKPMAVYCRSGRRSAAAAKALVQMGFKVYNLNGGIVAWEKAGRPVVKR